MLTLVNIGLLVTFVQLSVSQTFAQNGTMGCVLHSCVTEKSSSSSNVGIAVGVSLACLVVIAVVVGVIVYWKRVQFMTCVQKRFSNPFKRAAGSQDLNTNNTIPSGHYDKPNQHNTMPNGQYNKPDLKRPTAKKGNKTEVKEVEVRPISDPYYESIDLTKFYQQCQHVYTNDVPPEVDHKSGEKNTAHESEIIDVYEN